MSKRILFIVAAAILGAAGFYFQSLNQREARAKADAITAADTAGTNTDAAVAALSSYVKQHMGTTVSYTLGGKFARDEAAAKASANAPATNSQVYADAQKACGGKSDSITQAKCNQDYIAKHLVVTPSASPLPMPKMADYKLVLKAPLWTPDLAGALFLGAVLSFGYAIIGFMRRRF
jgi:hypothetical protein